jgi:DNA polymerase-3 subunit alpha
MLRNGETTGVFQFESWGITKLLKDVKVDCFNDLVAVNALYRPGPLRNGYTDKFAQGKFRSKHDYPHPKLEPILKATYGVIVFQEQVMEIASVLARLSPAQADDFRSGIGNKDFDKIHKQKRAFIDGCVANGVELGLATEIFNMLLQFVGYAFNKSHSTAYSFVAFYTAWLKYHYTLEYMTNLLNYEIGDDEGLRKFVDEGKRLKIKLLPPTINESKVLFTIEGGDIRCGLLALKGVGESVAKNIVSGQPYKSFDDFYERTKKAVDKGVIEVLKQKRVFRNIPMAKQNSLDGDVVEAFKKEPAKKSESVTGKQEKLF